MNRKYHLYYNPENTQIFKKHATTISSQSPVRSSCCSLPSRWSAGSRPAKSPRSCARTRPRARPSPPAPPSARTESSARAARSESWKRAATARPSAPAPRRSYARRARSVRRWRSRRLQARSCSSSLRRRWRLWRWTRSGLRLLQARPGSFWLMCGDVRFW